MQLGLATSRLALWCSEHRAAVLLLALAVVGAAAAGLPRLHSESYTGQLGPGDPAWDHFETLRETFGSGGLVIAALGCEQGPCDAFDPARLRALDRLADAAESLPGVSSVVSLTRVRVLRGDGEGLRAVRMRLDGEGDVEPEEFRRLALRDPSLVGNLLTPDGRLAELVIELDGALDEDARSLVADALRLRLESIGVELGIPVYVTGSPVLTAAAKRYIASDLRTLSPIMVLGVLLLFAGVFLDLRTALLPVVSILLSAVVVFGTMGHLGLPITPVVTTLPILILVIGVTDAMHLLVRVYEHAPEGGELRTALAAAVREIGGPSFVTAATASLGFLSFLTGPLPALRQYGALAALGVAGAFLATFTVLPALLSLTRLRPRRRPGFAAGDAALEAALGLSLRRAPVLLLLMLGVTALAGVGILRIRADNDVRRLVGDSDPVSLALDFVEENLRGTSAIEVLLETRDGGPITRHACVRDLVRAEEILLAQEEIRRVDSILNVLRVIHREMSGGEELALGRDDATLAQDLLLAESAQPGFVQRLVTVDQRMARLSADYRLAGARRGAALLQRIRDQLETELGARWSITVTGTATLNQRIAQMVLATQLSSFGSAFAAIFLVIALFLRSLRLGLLGMIPNVFPVAVVVGLMGWLDINLDVGTAMIASVVLGVSVDDTIYFLMHYRDGRAGGRAPAAAIRDAFERAGKPALFSSALLAAGFFVFAFSEFRALNYFGVLSGLAVLLAALSEVLLMPAVLLFGTRSQAGASRISSES